MKDLTKAVGTLAAVWAIPLLTLVPGMRTVLLACVCYTLIIPVIVAALVVVVVVGTAAYGLFINQ
jgi:hypothetical protein